MDECSIELNDQQPQNPKPTLFSDLLIDLQIRILELVIFETPYTLQSTESAYTLRFVCKSWDRYVQTILSRVDIIDLRRPQPLLHSSLFPFCKNLREIQVYGGLRGAGNCIARLTPLCSNLKSIKLDYCHPAMESTPLCYFLANFNGALKTLSLVGNSVAVGTGNDFLSLRNKHELEYLALSWCRNFNPVAQKLVLPALKQLVVKGCEALDVHNIIAPHLEILNAAFLPKLDDDTLAQIHTMFPSLKLLILAHKTDNLWSSGTYTERGVEMIRRTMPHLIIKTVHS